MQPQHIWPYIQHNLLHQTPTSLINSDHILSATNNSEIQQQNSVQTPIEIQDSNRQQSKDNKIIAKPLASRPTPFIHHGINHPHLHTLLAHCRNPYMTGKLTFVFVILILNLI